jgi:serine/threonine protein kinase
LTDVGHIFYHQTQTRISAFTMLSTPCFSDFKHYVNPRGGSYFDVPSLDRLKVFSVTTNANNLMSFLSPDGKLQLDIEKREKIDDGSFGEIHAAHNITHNVPCVLKTLLPRYARATRTAQKELRRAALGEFLLQHLVRCSVDAQGTPMASVPQVYAIGEQDNNIVVAMERMDGGLKHVLHALTAEQTIDLFMSVARLLQHLQTQHSFMHRDLHVGNVMFRHRPNGGFQWYVIDFGNASALLDVGGEALECTGNHLQSKYVMQEYREPTGILGCDKYFDSAYDLCHFAVSMLTPQALPDGSVRLTCTNPYWATMHNWLLQRSSHLYKRFIDKWYGKLVDLGSSVWRSQGFHLHKPYFVALATVVVAKRGEMVVHRRTWVDEFVGQDWTSTVGLEYLTDQNGMRHFVFPRQPYTQLPDTWV